MKDNCPSETALMVARRRAAHQILDDPKVFDDPLALPILGVDREAAIESKPKWLDDNPFVRVLRASLAARSRYTEDELHEAVSQGVGQYVILGAGLDTFAYRNPYPKGVLRVFEVDHPATQGWKRARLEEEGIPIPEALTFTPIDFQAETLDDSLGRKGLDTNKAAFFSWLGVTMYLTDQAIKATLEFVASLPAGSRIVFDYMVLPELLDPMARRVFDFLANRVAATGEHFQSFFDPAAFETRLLEMGFTDIKDLDPQAMNDRYFKGGTEALRTGSLAHVMSARV